MIAEHAPRLLLSVALLAAASCAAFDEPAKSERPKPPPHYTVLDPISANIYNLKAEPVERVYDALYAMNEKGWVTIRKYFPALGLFPDSNQAEQRVNPRDQDDRRFFASFAAEDPGRSPMPLIAMIISLAPADVSGPLRPLREELVQATKLEDYESWKLADLRAAIDKLTQEQTSVKGVKYQAPRRQLSFQQTVQLYAMSVALLRKETKWQEWIQKTVARGYTVPPPLPDMNDLANRLMHQLPVTINDGETRSLFLYRVGRDLDQPVAKGELEERADVVRIKRTGTVFTAEQFPVYLTADQKEWNPSWIETKDELKDTTLIGRKYECEWTRFDGPFLRYRYDQLNGAPVYQATVRFEQGGIVIEADRFVSRRGQVMRARRDPNYDPANMIELMPGAEPPADLLSADWLDLELATPMPKRDRANLEYLFYRPDSRQFLSYQTGPNSVSSSLYPPLNAAPATTGAVAAQVAPSDHGLTVTAVPVKADVAPQSPSVPQ